MGANLCSLRGPRDDNNTSTIYDLIKRRCWKRGREKVSSPQKQHKVGMKSKHQSLEELLLASPDFVNGGQFHVLRSSSSRRRVHPSLARSLPRSVSSSACGGCEVAEDEYSYGSNSISISQSGRLKKKVSFRLPQESDIIVFHSPEDDDASSDANVHS